MERNDGEGTARGVVKLIGEAGKGVAMGGVRLKGKTGEGERLCWMRWRQ